MKPKIALLIGDRTKGGGTERMCAFLANALARSGRFAVSVVSLQESRPRPAFGLEKEVRPFRLSRSGSRAAFLPASLLRLLCLCRRERFSVLIDVDVVLDVLSLPCARLSGAKLVSWEHFSFGERVGSSLRPLIHRLTCRFSDHIVVLTEADRALYLREGKPRCPVTVIRNPADFLPLPEPQPPREKVVLACGGLVPRKRMEHVIEIAALLRDRFPDWRFRILGEGPERPRLEALVRERGLSGAVELPGFAGDMAAAYADASLFLLTSTGEGLPMVLLEAKYFRLPPVSYDIPCGPNEIILDGVNGFLVSPGSTEQAAEKLALLMGNDELRRSFSAHAWDNLEPFRGAAIVRRWEELLGSLTAGKEGAL